MPSVVVVVVGWGAVIIPPPLTSSYLSCVLQAPESLPLSHTHPCSVEYRGWAVLASLVSRRPNVGPSLQWHSINIAWPCAHGPESYFQLSCFPGFHMTGQLITHFMALESLLQFWKKSRMFLLENYNQILPSSPKSCLDLSAIRMGESLPSV